MASRSRKWVRFAEGAYERFVRFAPSDQEVGAVCEALEDVASNSGRGYRLLTASASGDAIFRLDVGRFAVVYQTGDIVQVIEVYIP